MATRKAAQPKPEPPVVTAVPGINDSVGDVVVDDNTNAMVAFTCPSCGTHTEVAANDPYPTCNDCGVPLGKD